MAKVNAELAKVEFGSNGDVARAVALLGANACTIAEFAEWQTLRDDFIKSQASAAAQRNGGQLRLKVSEKGAVSLYGLNSKFPVTIYGAQWLRVLDFGPQIRKFIEENKSKLSSK